MCLTSAMAPFNTPSSTMPPAAVQRKARRVPSGFSELPPTVPALLIDVVYDQPPPSVPKSLPAPSGLHSEACM